MENHILCNKRLLAVDDEPDVLETLEEQVQEFEGLIFDKASDYASGYQMIRSWSYDLVILDIMGVRGFDLLNAAVHLGFPTVMLTAHALTPDALKTSIELGARAFIPKDKMGEIVPFLEDVLALDHRSGWRRVFERLGSFFSASFGPEWRKNEKAYREMVDEGTYEQGPVILE